MIESELVPGTVQAIVAQQITAGPCSARPTVISRLSLHPVNLASCRRKESGSGAGESRWLRKGAASLNGAVTDIGPFTIGDECGLRLERNSDAHRICLPFVTFR